MTWFKAYTDISREALGAAIDQAHKRGLKFTGHLCSVSFREAVELHIDTLEHGFFTNSDYVKNRQPDHCSPEMRTSLLNVPMDSPEVQRTIQAMVSNKVALNSTLAVYELSIRIARRSRICARSARARDARGIPERAPRNIGTRGGVVDARAVSARSGLRARVRQGGRTAWRGCGSHRAWRCAAGFGDQRNYELLIEAGFSPIETIQIMTLNGAKILGVDRISGRLPPERSRISS